MSIEYLEPLTKDREHGSMTRILRDLEPDSELRKGLLDSLHRLFNHKSIKFVTCVEQKLTRGPVRESSSGAMSSTDLE